MATSKVLKALLILGGIFVVVAVAIVVGAVLWFRANAGDLQKMGTRGMAEGSAFGAGKGPATCETEALTRVEACHGIMCQAEVKIFLDACFRASTPDAHFCDGVPKRGKIFETVGWVDSECQRLGKKKGDQMCTQLLQAVPEYCSR
jgi:hypothetical protein